MSEHEVSLREGVLMVNQVLVYRGCQSRPRQMSVIEQVPATQGYLLREMPLFNEMVCCTMRFISFQDGFSYEAQHNWPSLQPALALHKRELAITMLKTTNMKSAQNSTGVPKQKI